MSQDIGPQATASDRRAVAWRAPSVIFALSLLLILWGLQVVDLPVDMGSSFLADRLPAIGAVGLLGLALWSGAVVGPRLISRSRGRRADTDTRADHGEVAHLRQEAEAAREMIDSAVHELSSPVTSMGFQLHTLQASAADRLEADERALIERTIEDLGRCKRLISDLRDSTRARDGRLDLQTQRLQLDQFVEQEIQRHRPEAQARDVALTVHVEATPWLEADPDRLAQILSNLLSNAVSYTPPGGRVRVVVGQTDGLASVRVCDTGLGLAEEDLSRIFEPYARAHQAVEGAKGGTGLGLHIAQLLAGAHGGRLTARSPGSGHGSTFTLTLPIPPTTGSTDDQGLAGHGPAK